MAKKEVTKQEVKENEVEEKEIDLAEILLDENNADPIELYDENEVKVSFEQVAVVPLDNETYVILKPIEEMEGVADDEAVVFKLSKSEEGSTILVVENDDSIGEKVFEEYYKLLDEDEAK
ncbi:MAG: hypothetical protein RR400_03470 [Clostridia bacterium]